MPNQNQNQSSMEDIMGVRMLTPAEIDLAVAGAERMRAQLMRQLIRDAIDSIGALFRGRHHASHA